MKLEIILRGAWAGFIVMGALLAGCARAPEIAQFGGNTMGTSYQVTCLSPGLTSRQLAGAVETLLEAINQSLSTYRDTSVISQINTSTDTGVWHPVDTHFEKVFRRARAVYKDTEGAFNPAVGPLVDAWGFGPKGAGPVPDEATIRALLSLVSFDSFELRDSPPAVRKLIPHARLNFNAIGEGYAVDAIAALLEQEGIDNYLVEIGGEVRARGRHPEGRDWQVAIEKPAADALAPSKIQIVVSLQDGAMGTSGNYRNYRIEDGEMISHILDPRTGYPERSSLLSVSVLARDATTADAYATAFMVMGLAEALAFVEAREGMEAFFVTRGDDGNIVETRSSGFPAGK